MRIAEVNEPVSTLARATQAVRERLGDFRPNVAIVLGSGLGHVAGEVHSAIRIPQSAIPGFPQPSVQGHKGELIAGTLAGTSVIVQSGRFHLYEGHPVATVALPVRVYAELGVSTLILTNAAGGIRPTFRPGTLMLIRDHINLMWRSPLTGSVLAGEQRFPDMSDVYDGALRDRARKVARERQIPLEEGVYCALLGPSYETPAEIRMFQRLGADAVGMSTVPEVLVARARGIKCLGISTVTNVSLGVAQQKLSHEEVLATGREAATRLATLLGGIVQDL
jgi:purine-nucleoside phosphorylase